MEILLKIILTVLVLALIAFGIWAHFAGPCWIWTFSKASEVPYRCFRS